MFWSRGAYSSVSCTVNFSNLSLGKRWSTKRNVIAVGLWAAFAKVKSALDSRTLLISPTATVSFPKKAREETGEFLISLENLNLGLLKTVDNIVLVSLALCLFPEKERE